MTWRKGPTRQGMMRLAITYSLHRGEEELAIAQCMGPFGSDTEPWFWYGDGINTASTPKTLAECKLEAVKHFKDKISGQCGKDKEKAQNGSQNVSGSSATA